MSFAVDPAALDRHLAALPGPRRRPYDAAAIDEALRHLETTFASCGWQVRRQPCRDEILGEGANVIARLPGARPDALVVVGAHHDTVPGSPGADDNGSGLAALLELARLLPRGRHEATIELVAFDFEESNDPATQRASFAGSRAYAASLPRDGHLRGAFVYDLIGYADMRPGSQRVPRGLGLLYPTELRALRARRSRADFIAALAQRGRGAELLGAFVAAARAIQLPVLSLAIPRGLPLKDLYRSDHATFWTAGLPAVFLTDTANFRNPHYHAASDTPATLDAEFWARVVAATAATVEVLAASDS